MKKKIIGFIIATLLIMVFGFCVVLNVEAEEASYDNKFPYENGAISWRNFSYEEKKYGKHWSLGLLSLNYSDFDENNNIVKKIHNWCSSSKGSFKAAPGDILSKYNYYDFNSGFWGYNSICLESNGKDDAKWKDNSDKGVNNHPIAMISLEQDGSGKIYSYKGDQVYTLAASDQGKDMAFLSYVATKMRDEKGDNWKNGIGDGDYSNIYYATLYTWLTQNFRQILKNATNSNITFPGSSNQNSSASSLGPDSLSSLKTNYGNVYGNCKAKIIVLGLTQSKLYLYGTKVEENPNATLKKYITKIENAYGKNENLGTKRLVYGDTEKRSDLPQVSNAVNGKRSRITYEIKITNTGNCGIKGTFKDDYIDVNTKESLDSLSYVSANYTTETEAGNKSGSITAEELKTGKNIDIKKGGNATITVVLNAPEKCSYNKLYTNLASYEYKKR